MYFLFIFLDGVGLGPDDPATNPLASTPMPNLLSLLGGRKLVAGSAPFDSERASLVALDANLGVNGLPQSATGQASLLTGRNVSAALGYHYGPKPDPAVAEFLRDGNLFSQLKAEGKRSGLLNAYPQGYYDAIASGYRNYSAIPLAVVSAGIRMLTSEDLKAGAALSADFTGQGWRERLGLPDTPLLTTRQAGQRLAELANGYDFSFFEYWLSDYAGHHQSFSEASRVLESFDQVLGGLLSAWQDDQGLVLVTSDHGNMEDLSTRRHTSNPVPALVIGSPALRRPFIENLHSLVDVAPGILNFFQEGHQVKDEG